MRIGLYHLLHRLADLQYAGGWPAITPELRRVARMRSGDDLDEEQILLNLPWEKVFDFCERLYGQLAKDVVADYDRDGDPVIRAPKTEVQEYIANELRQLFLEENLAFEFADGRVRRRGRRHTAEQVARAEMVLGDARFYKAREHFNKALRFFRNVSQPDYENAVKEAVCAVEATAHVLHPSGGATLGRIVNSITGSEVGQLPDPIAKTFHGLYGFRSGGEGIGHGSASAGPATKELGEYALAVAASQIVLLVGIDSASEPDVPF